MVVISVKTDKCSFGRNCNVAAQYSNIDFNLLEKLANLIQIFSGSFVVPLAI